MANPFRAPLLWRYTAAEVRRRPGRSLLTLLGIVIGVASTVAITISIQTASGAHRDLYDTVGGRAALEVVAPGLEGLDENLCERLAKVPGVKAAVPLIQSPAALVGRSGPVPVMVLGIDPVRDEATRRYHLRDGRGLQEASGLLMAGGFARGQGIELESVVRLWTPTGLAEVPVVGLLEPQGAAAFNGGAIAFLRLADAQRLFGMTGQVNSVQLVLRENVEPSGVEAAIRSWLPAGLMVQVPAARGALGREAMASPQQALATMSVSSLVAGAFVILNAFLMNLGERRRQLAILRALGASRGQISRLLLREALLLGLVGTALGLALGAALAEVTRAVVGQILGVALPKLEWTSEPFLYAAVLGPGVALAATLVPARRASRRSPLNDLLLKQASGRDYSGRWVGYVGIAILALFFILVQVGIRHGWFEAKHITLLLPPGLALFLVGSVLSLPAGLGPLARLAAWLFRPLWGREGDLALRQLLRHRTRTALTAGVLGVAVAFAVGWGQSFLNNLHHIHDWFGRVLYTDFYVRGAWPDVSVSVTTVTVPESLAEEIAALDGVERVEKFRFVLARAGGVPAAVLVWALPYDRPLPLPLAQGDPAEVLRGLGRGEVVLGTVLAHRLGLQKGDAITVATAKDDHSFQVAGTTAEYTTGGMALYMAWDTAKHYFRLDGAHTLMVTARPGAAAGLAERLGDWCRQRGLLVQSNAETRATFDAQTGGFLGFIRVLIALVFIVASLGVVNTLTMNVLEQTRELGVLRAIGVKRGQLAKMIVAQALALGFVSVLPGVGIGLVLAYLMNIATYPLTGQPVPFGLDTGHIVGCFTAALAIAVGAAILPARRAARLQVVEALRYE